MKAIKFSHDYFKLPVVWEGTCAVLLGVSYYQMSTLKLRLPQLIEYDTRFRGEEGSYPLDFEDGIVLVFFHLNTSTLFTTIRRHTPDKFRYYKDSVSETFLLAREREVV